MKNYYILEIEVPEYCSDCGGTSVEYAELKTKQFSFEEMLKDYEFRQKLIQAGWADTKSGDGLEDKDLGPRTLLVNDYGHGSYVSSTIVDPKNQSSVYQIVQGSNHFLAIEVSEDALLRINPDAAKVFKDAVARRAQAKKAAEAAAKKRKEAAATKKQKTDAKKLEDAKKLLLKAGVKVVEA